MDERIIVAGIILIILGVVLGWLLLFPVMLVTIGVVLLIYGVVAKDETKGAQYPPTPQAQPFTEPAGLVRFCQYCGQQTSPGAVRCSSCGRSLTGGAGAVSPAKENVASVSITCPYCGTQNPASYRFCSVCAWDLTSRAGPNRLKDQPEIPMETLVICPSCGSKNMRTEQFCINCDKDLTEVKAKLVNRLKT